MQFYNDTINYVILLFLLIRSSQLLADDSHDSQRYIETLNTVQYHTQY